MEQGEEEITRDRRMGRRKKGRTGRRRRRSGGGRGGERQGGEGGVGVGPSALGSFVLAFLIQYEGVKG